MADTTSAAGPADSRHILIIVENLPVPFDRRVWQEATALTRNGYRVSVICPTGRGHTKRFERRDGIDIYRHSLPLEASNASGYAIEYSAALFWQVLLAVRIYRRNRFHAIHACNPPDTIFLVAWLFKPLGVRFLFDHHDLNPELFIAKFGRRGVFHRLLLWLERLTFLTANAVISTSETFRRIAIARGKVPEERIYLVRSAPDPSRVKRGEPNPDLRSGKRYVIGYVGIMGRQDGVDLLLEAVRVLVRDRGRGDFHCLVVGDGTERQNLEEMARRMGLQEHVTFTGYLSGEDLLSALSTFDVGVIPDPKNEYNNCIAMNKVFEYMAMAVPFVQFELEEGRRLAGDAALYATPNDPGSLADRIVELIDDDALRAKLAEVGRSRIERKLNWPHEEASLLAAYASLWR